MEYVRLTPNEYTDPIDLCSDSNSSLELSAPHSLWNSNLAASSQLWPLEFIAARTRIFVVDTAYKGPGTIINTIDLVDTPPQVHANDPWWFESPRGITYVHIGTFLGRETLIVTTDEGDVYMWRTLAIRQGVIEPWFHHNSGVSTWGVDAHPVLPLLAFSDNSGTITVLKLRHNDAQCLEVVEKKQSAFLGGNVPSICFIGNHIGYTMLTLDLLAGSFGVLNLDLEPIYTNKMQQAGWSIKPLSSASMFVKANRAYDLCGSETGPGELDLVECTDACHTSYILDLEGDRLGLQSSWVQPQTWVKEQRAQLREWVKHGRRKPLCDKIDELDGMFFLVSTSTHAFLVDASTGLCLGSAERALMPPGILPGPEFSRFALSIVEVIEPLGIAILVSRAATVTVIRFTQDYHCKGFRQELVLCDFPDFIVGLSCSPIRAHDFEYDLRTLDMSTEPQWTDDVPDKSLGDVGTYLVRLHTKDGRVEAFLLTS